MTWEFVALWAVALALTTLVGSEIVKRRRDIGWGVFTTLASSYLIINMLLVPRVIEVPGVAALGISAAVVSGTVFWPFITQMFDMVNEIYGRTKALSSMAIAFVGRIVVVLFILMAAQTTPVFSDSWTPETEKFWRFYFEISAPQIFFAGLVSYVLQETANILVFSKLKKRWAHKETTRGLRVKYGFYRSWTSDLVDNLVDSPTFYVLAFWGTMPFDLIWTITLSAIVIKLLIAQFNQPFYIWFRWRTHEVQREF